MYRAQPKDGPAWVTGASSGIGRAVALELARRGYQVAITARRRPELESLAAESDRIFSFPGDTTDRAGQAMLVQEIESKLGGIALAFLNAGAYFIGERTEFSADLIWRTFEINVGGTINGLAPLLAAMKRRGRGQIALNSSLAGYGGIAGAFAYGSTKAALIYMAEALKLTYEQAGLAVQIVNPGFVHSEMTAQNDFDMPLIMSAARAARIICDGFEKSSFEICFPRRLATVLKAVRLLPYPLYFSVMQRGTKRAHGQVS
ncbi:MAG: SDR family NAD(P)-dependent oxidoreductase [Alphaproteobacteria bacterium]|nr:SDR family NAD(P)-dependent oxidoreductase [Alphaproteobacteria bacterium]